MSSKTLSSGTTSVRLSGRPKGVPTHQGQRILDAWDNTKQATPNLSTAALLNIVAEVVFGPRLNISVRHKDRQRIRRTLKRHGRL
jgi:hypothetical protein